MKTSAEWWEEVKKDEAKFNDWLKRQYVGEVSAANRMMNVVSSYEMELEDKSNLMLIASQEMKHAAWIKELLVSRNIPLPSLEDAEKRYWSKVIPNIKNMDDAFAAAAHAEKMRLERIEVISNDGNDEVNHVFKKIKKDEVFHAAWFAAHATKEALEKAKERHREGLKQLSLALIDEEM